MTASGKLLVWFTAMTIAAAAMSVAGAQPGSGGNEPNALQGFQQNRNQPVQIEAATLEVRDKDKVATFSGNVKVVQGDTTMRCKSLTVFYEPKSPETQGAVPVKTSAASRTGGGGSSQISRLEAKGGVTVTQKDQTATGDTGLFDMRSNTITLLGNVLVSQGLNVLRGDKLTVDLTTGVSKVVSKDNPVRMLMQQTPQGKPGSSPSPVPGLRPGGPR